MTKNSMARSATKCFKKLKKCHKRDRFVLLSVFHEPSPVLGGEDTGLNHMWTVRRGIFPLVLNVSSMWTDYSCCEMVDVSSSLRLLHPWTGWRPGQQSICKECHVNRTLAKTIMGHACLSLPFWLFGVALPTDKPTVLRPHPPNSYVKVLVPRTSECDCI